MRQLRLERRQRFKKTAPKPAHAEPTACTTADNHNINNSDSKLEYDMEEYDMEEYEYEHQQILLNNDNNNNDDTHSQYEYRYDLEEYEYQQQQQLQLRKPPHDTDNNYETPTDTEHTEYFESCNLSPIPISTPTTVYTTPQQLQHNYENDTDNTILI